MREHRTPPLCTRCPRHAPRGAVGIAVADRHRPRPRLERARRAAKDRRPLRSPAPGRLQAEPRRERPPLAGQPATPVRLPRRVRLLLRLARAAACRRHGPPRRRDAGQDHGKPQRRAGQGHRVRRRDHRVPGGDGQRQAQLGADQSRAGVRPVRGAPRRTGRRRSDRVPWRGRRRRGAAKRLRRQGELGALGKLLHHQGRPGQRPRRGGLVRHRVRPANGRDEAALAAVHV